MTSDAPPFAPTSVPAPPAPLVTAPAPAPRYRPSRARVFRDVVQACALITAAFWGAYTFIYKEVVIPSRRAAALVVTPSLEVIGRRGDTVLARATFQLANHSDSKVYAPAVWYSVRGMKLEPVATDDTAYLRANRETAQQPWGTSRFSRFTAAEVVAEGKVENEVETWFEPGAEQRVEALLYLPADRYDAAQLQVQSLVTKDVGELQEIRWHIDANGDLEPRLVFKPSSPYYAGGRPATLSDTTARYVAWLHANQAGVNFVTATLSLWRNGPPSSEAAPPAAAAAR